MNKQILELLNNLDNFLDNIDSINRHPYSKGLNTDKLISDLKDYVRDMINIASNTEESEEETASEKETE